MGFATKWKTKKICAKEWSKKHIFLSHFFIFHRKPKRMLKFLRNGHLSHSGKMHFSVSGHVTLGVVPRRHELDYICPLWVLSKFGPIEAYMCTVIASWFFPSNGIKRYFNGPLKWTVTYTLDFCIQSNSAISNSVNSSPLFRTKIEFPRIYPYVFSHLLSATVLRTRLFRISRDFELVVLSLHFKSTPLFRTCQKQSIETLSRYRILQLLVQSALLGWFGGWPR